MRLLPGNWELTVRQWQPAAFSRCLHLPSFIAAFVWLSYLRLSGCDLVSNWPQVGRLPRNRIEIRIVIVEGGSVLSHEAS